MLLVRANAGACGEYDSNDPGIEKCVIQKNAPRVEDQED